MGQDTLTTTTSRSFVKYSWALLVYCLVVILWGAFVRATGSGAGCGAHWPLCNGEVLPRTPQLATIIEFTHRITSAVIGLLVLVQTVWAFKRYSHSMPVRVAALGVLAFTITEGLLGRALVKYGWVDQDASIARAVAMSLHLVNTIILLAFMVCTAAWAGSEDKPRLKGQGAAGWILGLGIVGLMFLGISGAVTALGDTLFPARDSFDVIERTWASGAHLFERLRIIHPLLAMTVGLYAILMGSLISHLRRSPGTAKWGTVLSILVLVQAAAGGLNVVLKAPVWMQMVHLLLADLTWIAAIMLAVEACYATVPCTEAIVDQGVKTEASAAKATWRDYLALTKPKVISLLLFTCLAAMFIAAGGWPGLGLLAAVSIGGYMAAGSANAINMVIERDLDGRMKRTSKRPTVTAAISSNRALLFAGSLGVGSFALLWAAANLLSACLALSGLVFYVVVYTMLLKRRTWQNIVIGGAAGSFPPLVGWAAVTGSLSVLAWYLFAIIFLWTPVHFWALALMIKEDYREAGVPMLPVVAGDRATTIQIGIYAILTSVISSAPFIHQQAGWLYLISVLALNAVLLSRSLKLYRLPDRPRAVSLYLYSMLYLALLFLVLAIDRAVA